MSNREELKITQQPKAWFTEDHLADKSSTTYDKSVADRWTEKGWPVSELYGREAVLALIAEVERLRTAEGDAMTYKAGMENCAAQRDELKAENKTLRYFLDRARGHLKIAGYANTVADIDNALDTGK